MSARTQAELSIGLGRLDHVRELPHEALCEAAVSHPAPRADLSRGWMGDGLRLDQVPGSQAHDEIVTAPEGIRRVSGRAGGHDLPARFFPGSDVRDDLLE
ncbi:hypothetical protein ACH4ND_25335 [Streptomyces sp. NPDC017179]|uniref:hypothetical protein n=1 Tax=Streptomyces sp. NPDC017179 TaxID=3364979 RepID=UPI0037A5865B